MTILNIGRVRLGWTGAWDIATAYTAFDAVTYGGGSYACTIDSAAGILPTNITYWQPMALAGVDGDTGSAGTNGDDGATGDQGIQGVAGEDGPQGVQGLTGPQGAQGNAGPQGNTGLTGDTGTTGAQGPLGNTGPAGIQGDTGTGNRPNWQYGPNWL